MVDELIVSGGGMVVFTGYKSLVGYILPTSLLAQSYLLQMAYTRLARKWDENNLEV